MPSAYGAAACPCVALEFSNTAGAGMVIQTGMGSNQGRASSGGTLAAGVLCCVCMGP